MKKKLLTLLLGGMLICSCNNNDDLEGGDGSQHQGVKDAYLSLSIKLPSASKTRVGNKPAPGESGDGHEVGEASENEVKSLLVFGFPHNGVGTAFKKSIPRADLMDLNSDENEVRSYKTKAPFQVVAGKYHLYVMVNPTQKMKDFSETQGEDIFKDSKIEYDATNASYKTDNFDGFPMSSADEIIVTEITSANTKSNPAFFSTAVQRLFAKVVLEDLGENLGNTKALFAKEFKFTRYGIVNQRKDAYWFRRAGMSNTNAVIGAKDDKTNYIIDPIFDQKTSSYSEVVASGNYWHREETSAVASYWKEVQSSKNVEYCFENTMKKEAQLQGYTTGLVLEASFIPKDENTKGGSVTSGQTFFKYNDKYYAGKTDLEAVLPAVKKLKNVDDESDETQRNKLIGDYGNFGVKVFYKGHCYYHYWIRHANNGDPAVMGIMEFATVRNNVYKMTVNSVKQPGEPTPPVTPEHPDEETDVYLDVRVDVLPWIVRENSMDL